MVEDALLAAAIASEEDGVVVVDADQRVVFFNTGAEQMFGWTSPDILGQPLDVLIPTHLRGRHTGHVNEFERAEVASRRMSERSDMTARRRDGTEFPAAITITRVRVRDASYFLAIVRDVTTWQHAVASLERQTRQLQTIAAAMTTFLETRDWSRASRILIRAALAETQSAYGFTGVLMDGPVLRILAHGGLEWDDTGRNTAYDDAMRAHREGGHLEFRNFDNLFGQVIREKRAVLCNDPTGDPLSGQLPEGHPPLQNFLGVPVVRGTELVGVLTVANRPGGFTIREQSSLEVLGRMAGVLTDSYLRSEREALLEEQLRQSQKMEALGRLAGGIAHDFNNLLTVILGNCENLAPVLADAPAGRSTLGQIERAVSRGTRLVGQLLAFSRRQKVFTRRLVVGTVIGDLAAMLQRIIGEQLELVLEIDCDTPAVIADPSQIEQVIMNLVVNARDAMRDGGRLTIRLECVAAAALDAQTLVGQTVSHERYLALSVQDTGTGMSPQTMAHIFEPFFTTKEPGRGTGLGLSIVYGIVQQLGGIIAVDSDVTRGTTFRVYLPTEDCLMAAAGTHEGAQPAAHTVLVVENEPALLVLLVQALRSHGYTVLEAGGPAEALRIAAEHGGAISLIVSDISMPEMNGVDLVARIHAHYPDAKACYVSGYVDGVEQRSSSDPGTIVLRKPFSLAAFLTVVAQILPPADQPGSRT